MTLLSSTVRCGLLALVLSACDDDAEPSPASPADASPAVPADASRADGSVRLDAGAPVLDAHVDTSSREDARSPAVEDASAEDARTLDAQVGDAQVGDAQVRDASASSCKGVDVVWVVDSSGSLLFAESASQHNFAELLRRAPAADLNVIVVSDDAPTLPDAGAASFHRVQTDVDSKALFTTVLTQFNKLAPYLRAGIATHVVGITDDQDLLPAQQFKTELEALLGHGFTFHAVASPSVNDMVCISEDQLWNPQCVAPIPALCAAAAVGSAYFEAAALTGGAQDSICKHEWRAVLDRLTCP
ncbi:MAG: hypothetical protein ABW352_21440 [Polyangiales bacterium]